jgi:Ca2+ transporting ATPase
MVTGDNMLTAIAIAKEAGILQKDFVQAAGGYDVMEGKKFREVAGGLRAEKDGDDKTIYRVTNLEAFTKIAAELKVLSRASPEDKYILVTGLMSLGHIVAVTGDGANDAPALRRADVGFAMGESGSDVAKDAADIILTDDRFSSIITACKWGRNIYNCIRKFIQF